MANKKINQLVSKTAILSTDIFGIGDATTGQLFKKTIAELQAAIGGAVISVNGLVGTVVLDTDDIQELATPTNKYFTDARARGAISLTVTGNSGASTYSSGTGVLNVPTYTLAGLGGITATFLSGTSGISYNSGTGVISYSGTVYTDASIRALLSAGTGISYNSTTGAISYSGTVYTDSSIRALISMTTTGDSGASTYNNTTGVINVPNYTLAGLGGISLTSLSGGTGISYNSSTGAISSTITQYTDALARASVSLTTTGTSGASTYNSTTGVFNIPQYQAVLTNPVTGTGTTNYVTKWTSSSAIGNSSIFDNGTNVGIGISAPTTNLQINGANGITDSYGQLFVSSNNTATQNFGGQVTLGGFFNGTTSQTAFGAIAGRKENTTANNALGYLSFSTQNGTITERMRISSAGYVGINTTAPNTSYGATIQNPTLYSSNALRLERGGVPTQGLNIIAGGEEVTFTGFNTASDGLNSAFIWKSTAYNTTTERMRITSAGNVGIGITAPGELLTLGKASGGQVFQGKDTTTNYDIGYIQFNTDNMTLNSQGGASGTTSYFRFITSNTERIRITAGGNILMGTTSDNGERLYVSGSIRATGTITANSDLTLKKNLLRIENALEKVEQINGYTYEFKEDDSKRYAGVIAQEIQTVLPEIVNKGNDGILGVEYGNISALLIEAIKEQQTQINDLKALLNK
jgi:hypothetical protein